MNTDSRNVVNLDLKKEPENTTGLENWYRKTTYQVVI